MHRAFRWLAVVGAAVVGPLLAEGIAWLQHGDSRPMPPMFAVTDDGRIGLASDLRVRGRTAHGRIYDVTTDATGHRHPAPPTPGWVLAGDSLAFGLGVADDETTAVHLTALGVPTRSLAAPGFSLAEALVEVEQVVGPGARGVVVWVNPVDDDRQQVPAPAHARTVVAGHAVHADTPAPLRALLASRLARSHVVSTVVHGLGLARQLVVHGVGHVGWARAEDGGAAAFTTLGASVASFARRHPCTVVVAVWTPLPGVTVPERAAPSALERPDLPLDDRAAVSGLRRGLGSVPLLDLRDVLQGRPDAYLPSDTHLSAAGHRRVAEALAVRLPDLPPSCP